MDQTRLLECYVSSQLQAVLGVLEKHKGSVVKSNMVLCGPFALSRELSMEAGLV